MKHFTSLTQKTGEKGEELACQYLKKHGFTIVERNIANKYGEIDIVAKKQTRHYFFEVKAGKEGGWLNPAENLTRAKLKKFLFSIDHYVFTHRIEDYVAQGITVLVGEGDPQIEILDLY